MNKVITWLILIMLLFPVIVFARTTEEIEINNLYKKAFSLIYEKLDLNNSPNINPKKAPEIIDCITEIYIRKPDSMEAYYLTTLAKYILKPTLKEKYEKLKEKHMAHLMEADFETGEKLIFLWLAASQYSSDIKFETQIDAQTINDVLFNIRDNCKNKNYSVLAAVMLSDLPSLSLECKKKIVEIAPDHPAIPFVLGEIAITEYDKQPQKCIEELQKLVDKYGNIESPNGWRMIYEYYFSMAYAYIDMKDFKTAEKYYEIINKEAPGYWDLKCLRKTLDILEAKEK